MNKKTITEIPINDKEYNLCEFKEKTKLATGVCVCEDRLSDGLKISRLTDERIYPDKIFFENGKVYYSKGCELYKVEETLELLYSSVDGNPTIVKGINYAGKEGLLIITDSGAGAVVQNGKTYSATLPSGQFYEVLGAQLYIGKGREIFFGNCHDLTGFNKTIVMPYGAGEIKGLIAYEKKLLIFCQSSVYELSPFGQEINYVLERNTVINLDVLSGSVKRLGQNVAFVSQGKIYCYDKGKLKQIKTTYDLSDFTVHKIFAVYNNLYMFAVEIEGRENYYVYVVDVVDGKEYLEPISSPCLCDGGYLTVNGKLSVIDERGDYLSENCFWQSTSIDFGSFAKKNLSEISLKTETALKVTVKSDLGKKVLAFPVGFTEKKVNVTSKEFVLTAESSDLRLKSIGLKYRNLGGL